MNTTQISKSFGATFLLSAVLLTSGISFFTPARVSADLLPEPNYQQAKMMSPEAFCSLDSKFLFRGTKGESVSKYQKLLSYYFDKTPSEGSAILPDLTFDGNFGKTTRLYTIQFQKMVKLTGDGLVGKKTRAALTNWCLENYNKEGAIASDNSYVKKVSLGDEFTVKPNSSFTINGIDIVYNVSKIYGNKCTVGAERGLGVVCTMEYNPTLKINGVLSGDVTYGDHILSLGETILLPIETGSSTRYEFTFVSVSEDGTSITLKIEKK